jgi:hypothetical protein
MNEEHRITETNPGGTKTRFSVSKHSKTGKRIGQPVIFTTRRGAEEHVARQTKPVAEDMAAAGPVNVAANVADPKNKPLLKSPLKRFKTFIKQ